MTRFVLAASIALAGLGSGAIGQAPARTSELIPGHARRGDAARTDPIFRRTIFCLVEREPSATRNLLATIPGTDAEARVVWRFQSRLDHCLPGAAITSISFPTDLLRGAVAEIYYRRAFPDGLPVAPAPASELAAAWSRPRVEEGRITQHETFHAMARCAVVREPGAVTALLAAAPFSAGEARAIGSLRGARAICIDPDTRLVASRQLLRGLLAEAALLYGQARRDGFGRPWPQ